MCLEVVEDDPIARHHHSTDEAHEAPILYVDAAIGLWLVSGLLYQLQVELIAERLLLQTLLYGQLHHADAVLGVNLVKPSAVGGANAYVHKISCGKSGF